MLAEHTRGDTYRALGARYGMSKDRARHIVVQERVRLLTQIECDLILASKLESMGRAATWPTFLVPHEAQEDWSTALSLVQFVVDRLKSTGTDVHVKSRPTPNGVAFMLTLEEESR
jgi:hypothetical protein